MHVHRTYKHEHDGSRNMCKDLLLRMFWILPFILVNFNKSLPLACFQLSEWYGITIGAMNDKLCDLCATKGLQKKLVYYHVNFEEAMLLCENNMVRIKSILINVIAMRFITRFLGGVISVIVCFGLFFSVCLSIWFIWSC